MDALDVLKEELKKDGLEIAEETAMALAKSVFKALPKVVAATENKYDDLLIPVLGVLEPKLMELIDGINPADNK